MEKRGFAASEYALSRVQTAVQVRPSEKVPSLTDADFKSFILYVENDENGRRLPSSFQAIEALSKVTSVKKDTLIQETNLLSNRPFWLDETPCLVIKNERRAIKGQEAVCQYLTQLKDSGLNQNSWQQGRKGPNYSDKKSRGHSLKKTWGTGSSESDIK